MTRSGPSRGQSRSERGTPIQVSWHPNAATGKGREVREVSGGARSVGGEGRPYGSQDAHLHTREVREVREVRAGGPLPPAAGVAFRPGAAYRRLGQAPEGHM